MAAKPRQAVSGKPGLAVEWWDVGKVKPYPKNPRKASEKSVKKVMASIREFGWRQPIVVDKAGVIVAGHKRWEAATKLQLKQVPVHVAKELNEAQIKQYRIMDNRVQDDSEWDLELLAGEVGDLSQLENVDLNLTGLDDPEIAEFLAQCGRTEGLTDPDEVSEPPVDPVSTLGDLWLLGKHRLLCGDSTSVEAVERLMAGEKADLVFTDPPYGVGYDGGTKVREKLAGDQDTALYRPCCQMAALHSTPAAALYLWHAGVKGIAAAAAAAAAGYEIRCEIVWNKNLAQFGSLSSQYKQKHETCYYCFKRGKVASWYGPTNEVTVWDCNRAQANEFHPTQKPVELGERAIGNSSKSGDSVLDFFGGSGSTLIACEKTSRNCRMMELAPSYIDVIVNRWQNFTGQKATLEGDGRTFEEIAADRKVTDETR